MTGSKSEYEDDGISKVKEKRNLLDFFRDAWSRTFTPSLEGNTTFFDYPSQGTAAQKATYFIPTFRFLTAPLMSLVKLPTEFLFRALAEFFLFIERQIDVFMPESLVLKGLQIAAALLTMMCRGIFLGISRLLRCVFSPIESANEALEINPRVLGRILCALSIIISLASYAATAIFAAPLLFSALPSLSVAIAQPVLNALNVVGTFLIATLGAPTALASLAIVGASFLYGARSFFDWCCFSSSAKDSSMLSPENETEPFLSNYNVDTSTSDDDNDSDASFSEAGQPPFQEEENDVPEESQKFNLY